MARQRIGNIAAYENDGQKKSISQNRCHYCDTQLDTERGLDSATTIGDCCLVLVMTVTKMGRESCTVPLCREPMVVEVVPLPKIQKQLTN